MASKVTDRKIGVSSMVLLFLNLTLAKYLLVVPSFIINETGNSAWMVILLKGAGALAMFAAVCALYKPYTGLGFGEVSRRAFGKFLGGLINAAVAGVIVLRGGFILRTMAEAVRSLEAENATFEYMALFILVPVLICAMKGFNANVNMSVLILPFTLVSVAAIAVVLIPHYRLCNIMPIFGEGPDKILKQSFLQMGGMFEIIYLLILSRYMVGYKQLKYSGFVGIGAVAAIAFIFSLIYCLAIPYPASKYFFFPLYQLTRLIKAGSFMQRMEPVVVFIWAGIIMCCLTTVTVGACELFKSAAGEKDVRGFVPITVILLFLIGAMPSSELQTYDLYRAALNVSHIFYVVLIFLVPLTARLRKISAETADRGGYI